MNALASNRWIFSAVFLLIGYSVSRVFDGPDIHTIVKELLLMIFILVALIIVQITLHDRQIQSLTQHIQFAEHKIIEAEVRLASIIQHNDLHDPNI